jgi:CIC family chloride channel protein
MGQLLCLPTWQVVTFIAAGAGGGIAATFNTPVGGVLFAVEIVMHEVSVRTLVPVVTATATATYVGQLFFGPHPSFSIPALETTYFQLTDPKVLVTYAILGVIAGLVSALFIYSIYGFEHFFENRVKGGCYVLHAAGMLTLGLVLHFFMRFPGHYYVEGMGYATIQDVLASVQFPFYFLILLFVAKLPALFLGATAGGAYGVVPSPAVPGSSH